MLGKYKYSSRFYFPSHNSVLCFQSDPWFHVLGSRLVGVQTGDRIFVCLFVLAYLLLNQLKAIWGRNCVWFLFPHCRQPCKFPEWMLEPKYSWKCTRVEENLGDLRSQRVLPAWQPQLKILILSGGLVQWVGLCTHIARGPGSIPDQGTRSHTPKIRPGADKKRTKRTAQQTEVH